MSQAAARGPEDSPHSDRSIPAPLVSRSAGYSQFSRADAPRTPREAPTPTVFLRAWSGWSRHQPPAVAKPDQSPSACPPGSARWRKDRNLGYEHRWTPNTAGPGGVNHDRAGGVYHPMSKLPRDALEQHRAANHVEPAGLQSRRVVSPLGLRMDFGTAYGRLAPEPQAQEVRNLPASGVGVDVSEFPGPVRSASTCSEQPGSECLAAPGGDDVAADIGFVQKPTSPADVTTLPSAWMQAHPPEADTESNAQTKIAAKIAADAVCSARNARGSFLDFCFDPTVGRDRVLDTLRTPAPEPGLKDTANLMPNCGRTGRTPRLPGLQSPRARMSSPRIVPPTPLPQPWGCVDMDALLSPRIVKGFELNKGPPPPFSARMQEMARTDRGLAPKPLLLPLHRVRNGVPKRLESQTSISTLSDLMFRRAKKLPDQDPAGLCTARPAPPGRRR